MWSEIRCGTCISVNSHLPTMQHNRSPSSFNCHLLQFVTIHSIPLTLRLTALGPHWGESNGLWAQLCVPNWMAHPFVKYTFSNKNWQRNLISIQGEAEALSLEKINCYPLSDCVWQFLNRLDKGFIISPWNSHIEISDKQCNRKGTHDELQIKDELAERDRWNHVFKTARNIVWQDINFQRVDKSQK